MILSCVAMKEKRGLRHSSIYRRIPSIMATNRNHLAIAFGVFLVLGGSYIIYAGRPVMKMQEQQIPVVTPPIVTPTTTPDVAVTSTEPVATTTAAVPEEKPAVTTTEPTPTPEPTKPSGVYTMAEVQSHATVDNCWSAINGSVYDLTTWVGRHPGGENPIKGLCGTDGSAKFNRKHGETPRAQSMLILLKIGTLK